MPRFHCPVPLATGAELELPPGAARHVQVLRLQPGDTITLFHGGQGADSPGGEFDATVLRMGRSDVLVQVGAHHPEEREAARAVHLIAGITANERMDWLIEKATELGVASIQPLMSERSVLRLSTADGKDSADERSAKKTAHWRNVAISAAEQCGRTRVPTVAPVLSLPYWLAQRDRRLAAFVLSPPHAGSSPPLLQAVAPGLEAMFLIGPEGGLSEKEVTLALEAGCKPCHLGARVLRAETAPLAILAALALRELR